MGTVSEDTLFTDVFDEVEAYIKANVTNPHTTGQWIYTTFPQDQIENKSAYPILTVAPTSIVDQKLVTFRIMELTINVEVTPYTTRKDTLDEISSEIFKYMNSSTELKSTNLKNIRWVDTTDSTETLRKNFNVHQKTMIFSVTYHYTIS